MAEIISIDGGIRVVMRRSLRARRMTLRVPRDGGDAVLTLPGGVPESAGRAFVDTRAEWLRQATARVPARRLVEAGAAVPVEGRLAQVVPAAIRAPQLAEGALMVPRSRAAGPAVAAFLKHLARDRLAVACDHHAAALGRDFSTIVLRDTRSRWGSCTADGRLMFSWRLAMAPPEVLDYVAAHEVAHLVHMDHSARFWAVVQRLMPDYRMRRDWLRRHGSDLMLWRFAD